MNAMRKLKSCTWLIVALVGLMLTGCKPAVTVNSEAETDGVERESDVKIVANEMPSEESKSSMLAAKEALFQRLSGALMEAMIEGGPTAAIKVCQSKAPAIAKEVSQEYGLKIGRTGVRLRNPKNLAPQWSSELTEELTDTPQFLSLSNGHSAALLPIKLQAQCVMCHGPEDQIIPEVKSELAKVYPDDQAIGFQEGELRGWFWIEMPSQS